MSRHFVTLYELSYRNEDGDDRVLGNIDGQGRSVVQLFDDIVNEDLPNRDDDREVTLGLDSQDTHPDTIMETYVFRYGRFGDFFDVTPRDNLGQVIHRGRPDESTVSNLGAALIAPANEFQGWLITHSIGSRASMVTHLKAVLRAGMNDRNVGGTLHIEPAHSNRAWELMLERGEVRGFLFRIPAENLGDRVLVPGVDFEALGEVDVVVKPDWGRRFSAEDAHRIRRLAARDELVVLRSQPAPDMEPESTTIEVSFAGGTRRLDIEAGEAPVKIPRLETNTRPPADETVHDWMRREAQDLLEILQIRVPGI